MHETIASFIEKHFRHFNAATLRDAARAYATHLNAGGHMMVTLAGAMSTAEIGRSLGPMIREGKVHAVTCTAANLEEDLFNLVAHDDYQIIPIAEATVRGFSTASTGAAQRRAG